MHSSALLRSSSITGAARLNDAVKLVMEKQIGSVQSDSARPKVLMSAKKKHSPSSWSLANSDQHFSLSIVKVIAGLISSESKR